ncbi:hypothetical protein [Paenibacillus sp. NEAU-GSW1]|uniref:hypothetical protein n=1 Tax=Paenibacillus sp. NEAU-GSW1 TaxID=2682486 RepID=UPI0012E14762|nr:hypothetical protein [Paenibacillus sp. NEAU-GSW1]MUT64926.1 hypothetical protein [Paenibacillus sp. NEAU-GSW1]
MHNSTQTQNENISQQPFTFEWNGGFSYLTYLKVKTDVTLSEQKLLINTKNYILGAFPGSSKTTEVTMSNIKNLAVSSKINWFDLVFSILFAVVTLISMKLWFLLLTAFFIWRTFNTCISITDHHDNKIRIPTGSKTSANSFVHKVSQVANQYMETAAEQDNETWSTAPQPIVPTKKSSKLKTIFLFASAAIIAIIILFVALQSRGSFDNQYVEWVKEGTVTGTNLKMSQVLENETYFSNIVWKEVQEEGNSLDKFVMYQATLSDQGVKVSIQTIFQVFGEDHFEAVETSSDGDILHTSDWYVFLADMADRYNNANAPKQSVQTTEPKQEQSPAVQETTTPSENPTTTYNQVTEPTSSEINLASFDKWSFPQPDITMPLELDGEKVDLVVGLDTPNGVKVLAMSVSLEQGWHLQLNTNAGGGSPFDDYGDLKEGFSLYIKEYDFENDSVPEVVIAASDGMLETYTWVFSYNYVFTEIEASPLDLIWYGEGQSDLILEDNKILMPFGSQGLFDEYVYSNNSFIKQ